MAHVQITMLAGRTIEQKRRAVKRITEALREELNVKPEKLTVAFVEVPRDSYARNGVLLSDRTDLQWASLGHASCQLRHGTAGQTAISYFKSRTEIIPR